MKIKYTIFLFLIFFTDRLLKIIFFNSGKYYLNNNIALGISIGENTFLPILITIIVLGIVMILVTKEKNEFYKFILLIIFTSGISNLLDRIIFNGVIDYINFFDLYMVNIADLAISSGIILLLILNIIDENKKFHSRKVR